ncbi:hypothetical protein [Psychrobacter glacincola]|uniref:hypothetical protein n=1 Tax=Psychrobacter glacincola TaxID=56810 RepID=UPI0039AFA0F3
MINKENYNNISRIAINPTSLELLAVLSFGAISEDIQDDIIGAQISIAMVSYFYLLTRLLESFYIINFILLKRLASLGLLMIKVR